MFDTVEQLTLLDTDRAHPGVVERAWSRAVEREKESRTRFAQRRIKPEEVARELHESDAVLGDAAAVQRFVHEACARFGAPLAPGAPASAAAARAAAADDPGAPGVAAAAPPERRRPGGHCGSHSMKLRRRRAPS